MSDDVICGLLALDENTARGFDDPFRSVTFSWTGMSEKPGIL